MNRFYFYTILVFIGALGYCVIEIIWRGFTHWSMAAAGGICLPLIEAIRKNIPSTRIKKAAVCALMITDVEFIFGVVFNLFLKMNVWDYSERFFNIYGQICPVYSVYWFFLSYAVMHFLGTAEKKFIPNVN